MLDKPPFNSQVIFRPTLAKPTEFSLVVGMTIAVLGEIIRIWAVAHAGSATRTTSGAGGDELVMTGPYGHVRNPLYVGNFFLSTGLCIAAWPWMPWMLLITTLLFGFQYTLIIHLEEEYLHKRFSRLYHQYCQHVPRLFPRFSRYQSGQDRIPSFQKALHSERSTLTSFTLVTLFILLRWQMGS